MGKTPTMKCLEVQYWEGWEMVFSFCILYLSVILLKILCHWFKNKFDKKTNFSLHGSPLLKVKLLLILEFPGTVEDFDGVLTT